jgi:hypothetical protein
MKMYGEWRYRSTILDLAPDAHWIGDWLGNTAGLEAVEERIIPCSCQESKPESQSRIP